MFKKYIKKLFFGGVIAIYCFGFSMLLHVGFMHDAVSVQGQHEDGCALDSGCMAVCQGLEENAKLVSFQPSSKVTRIFFLPSWFPAYDVYYNKHSVPSIVYNDTYSYYTKPGFSVLLVGEKKITI